MKTTKQGRANARRLIANGGATLKTEWIEWLLDDCDRLDELVNSPQTNDFLEAVRTEAAHQVERWGPDDRAKKSDADWLWLMTYLSAKAIFGKDAAEPRSLANYVRMLAIESGGDIQIETDGREKYLHRIVTVAAGAFNWFRQRWPGQEPNPRRERDQIQKGG